MTFAELLASNPDLFWALVYAAWGAVYAAIVTSTAAMYCFAKLWRQRLPEDRQVLFALQVVWSSVHLPGVFLPPVLIGTFAPKVLIEAKYILLMAVTCFCGVYIAYLLARRFVNLKELLVDAG